MSDYDRRVILRPEHTSSEEPELQWLEDSINGVARMRLKCYLKPYARFLLLVFGCFTCYAKSVHSSDTQRRVY